MHPEVGQQILRPLEDLGPIPAIVHQHHERPDGGGHPDGLRGEEILLEARIVAVADLVEHLVPAGAAGRDVHLAETAALLERQRGTGFDARGRGRAAARARRRAPGACRHLQRRRRGRRTFGRGNIP